jgi:rhodanese-related sulfurtransferase
MPSLEISPTEASELLDTGKARLIDVRETWELSQAYVEGAEAIPMGEIAARAPHELKPDEHLLILCHRGQRSLNVAIWLRNQGYENVQSVSGGISAWAAQVDPSIGRY